MSGQLFIGDNLDFLNKTQQVFDLVYMDPPYNTGNQFRYSDKGKRSHWIDFMDIRIKAAKKRSGSTALFIFSIAEDSLFDLADLLRSNFNVVAPPFVWQTKSEGNNNKVNSIMTVCHEYILVASDGKIVSKPEHITATEEKVSRYPYGIKLEDRMENYTEIVFGEKKVVCIPKTGWSLERNTVGFGNQRYQKRTAQKGHGSERYVSFVKQLPGYSESNLYFIKGVKDKSGLNGKFISGNSYFQSIGDTYSQKIPSFLGFYQAGIPGFQTAKPVELLKRVFTAFSNPGETLLDMFCGSGNASIAAAKVGLHFVSCELGLGDEKNPGGFAKQRLSEYLSRLEEQSHVAS